MNNTDQIQAAINYILQGILPENSQVSSTIQETGHSLLVNVICPPELAGQIIGKEGRIIKSIRQVMGLFATPINIQVNSPEIQ